MPRDSIKCPNCHEEISADAIKCNHCGKVVVAPPPAPAETLAFPAGDMAPGKVLSKRYKTVRQIGRGGMGVVHLAFDQELEMYVAIKFLPPELANDPGALEQLRSEARLSMSLAHPNIVRLHTLDTSGDFKFLVMEYVDGPNLSHVLREKGAIPFEQALPVVRSVCEGIKYAHSRRVLHRDLKPANIMLTSKGEVKIADFGIARQMRKSMSRLSQKVVSGTPSYMAPEHLMGEHLTVRSDIYSLGAVAYELLAGHPPFHQGDIAAQIRFKAPPPLAGIPKPINDAIITTLSKEPEKRPASASAFYKILTLATLQIRATPALKKKAASAPDKRRPKPAPKTPPIETPAGKKAQAPLPDKPPEAGKAAEDEAVQPEIRPIHMRVSRLAPRPLPRPSPVRESKSPPQPAGKPPQPAPIPQPPVKAHPPLPAKDRFSIPSSSRQKTNLYRLIAVIAVSVGLGIAILAAVLHYSGKPDRTATPAAARPVAEQAPEETEAERLAREKRERRKREEAAAREARDKAEAERVAREQEERRQREERAATRKLQKLQKLLAAGREALAERRYDDAIMCAREALNIKPDDPDAKKLLDNAAHPPPVRVPGDFPSIKQAVDRAANGETIVVADGIYSGPGNRNIDFRGKLITLKSENGAGACIIDCGRQGRAFYFQTGESSSSAVDGFTIKNGNVKDSNGGAILCDNSSSPAIRNCIVTGCNAEGNSIGGMGGAIGCLNESCPQIVNCVIVKNTAGDCGAGICCFYADPAITNCTITDNSADSGAGIYCYGASPTITNCTITANSASEGAGIYCFDSKPVLNNTILSGNTAELYGNEIYTEDMESAVTLNCSNIPDAAGDPKRFQGNGTVKAGSDCIPGGPKFLRPAGRDYRLQPASPCIDKGDNRHVPDNLSTDLDGRPRIVNGTVDIGAYEKQ